MTDLAVLGSGAFGTALAVALAKGGASVTLWGRNPALMADMQHSRTSPRLPGIILPETVSVSADIDGMRTAGAALIAIPTQQLTGFLAAHAETLRGIPLVACAKGIDLATGLGPTALLASACPGIAPALLTGPGFAADIAAGLPTALTLACRDPDLGARLQHLLSTPTLRLYRSTDVTGAELGGALKNVMAIVAGMVIGAGLGDSARAALMTRGYAEMLRLALNFGARPETLAGLSGLGDLILTCTSAHSRNFRHGLAIGAGQPPDAGVTVEGVATAHAAAALAQRRGIDMPITSMVAAVLDGRMPLADATGALLSRPLKQE